MERACEAGDIKAGIELISTIAGRCRRHQLLCRPHSRARGLRAMNPQLALWATDIGAGYAGSEGPNPIAGYAG